MKSKISIITLFCLLLLFQADGQAGSNILPRYDKFTLSNGLEVILIEDNNQPLLDIQMTFLVGSSSDSAALAGLAALTADMLREGSKAFQSDGLSVSVDASGGQLNAFVTRDVFRIRGNFLSRDLDFAMETLAKMVISPQFLQSGLDHLQKRFVSYIVRNESINNYLLENGVYSAIYGDDGYGLSTHGTVEGIRQIELVDVTSFYDRNIRPNNGALIVGGDFKSGKLKKKIKKLFGKWAKGSDFVSPIVNVGSSDTIRIILIDRPNAPGTEFMFGCRLGLCTTPMAARLMLLDYILGGGGEVSRLSQRLVDRQLATRIYSRANLSRIDGMLTISGATTNHEAIEAIRQTLEVIRELREIRVPAGELEEAKNFYRGRIPGYFETSNMKVSRFGDLFELGKGLDFFDKLIKEYETIGPVDIKEMAHEILDEELITLVIIGPGHILKKHLSEMAPVEVLESGRE